jgi:hypothetical protein
VRCRSTGRIRPLPAVPRLSPPDGRPNRLTPPVQLHNTGRVPPPDAASAAARSGRYPRHRSPPRGRPSRPGPGTHFKGPPLIWSLHPRYAAGENRPTAGFSPGIELTCDGGTAPGTGSREGEGAVTTSTFLGEALARREGSAAKGRPRRRRHRRRTLGAPVDIGDGRDSSTPTSRGQVNHVCAHPP